MVSIHYIFTQCISKNGLKSLIFVTIGQRPMEQVNKKFYLKGKTKPKILPFRQN